MGKSSNSAIRDFATDEAFSKSIYATQFFSEFYRTAFDDFIAMSETNEDRESQKRGIDRKVYRSGDVVLLIDEKLRRIEFPGDIFLEYTSRDVGCVPGWLNKEMDIDYIAYGWYPSRMGYLLEWQSLTAAWFTHGDNWKAKYPNQPSYNSEYVTWGVCVPTKVIRDTVNYQFIMLDQFQANNVSDSMFNTIQLSMFYPDQGH